jgi:hypothetical protein
MCALGGAAIRGAGHMSCPSRVTRAPRTTSSSRLMKYRPFSPIESRNLVMLFE